MRRRYKKFYKIRRKRFLLKSRSFWFLFLLIIGGGSISYLTIFSSFFQIREITVSGDAKIPAYEITDTINSEINKNFIFAESKSIFLVSLEEINKKITAQFPQIAKVSLKRMFPDVLALDVRQRKPVASWCQENKCFYLDEGGVIFEENEIKISPQLKSEVVFPDLKLGKPIIDSKYLARILDVNKQIEKNPDFSIKEIVVSGDAKKIKIMSSEGWYALFNLDESISTQISNLSIVLSETISVTKRKNLDYINLRFGNRVYVKYK